MRERLGDVPTGPAFDHGEATEPLFALFEFFQNAQRRNWRREAVVAGFDQLRAAGEFYVEEERPGAANHALGQKLVGDSLRR